MEGSSKCAECGGPAPCCRHRSYLPPFSPCAVAELERPGISDIALRVMLAIRYATFARNVRKRPTYKPKEMSLETIAIISGGTNLAATRAAILEVQRLGVASITTSGVDMWMVEGIPPQSRADLDPKVAGKPDPYLLPESQASAASADGKPDHADGKPDRTDLDDLRAIVSTRISDRAKAEGLTHRQLAARAGVSRSALEDVLARKASPRIEQLAKIAWALGCSVASLVEVAVGEEHSLELESSESERPIAQVIPLCSPDADMRAALVIANAQRKEADMGPIDDSAIAAMRQLARRLDVDVSPDLRRELAMPMSLFAGYVVAGLAAAHAQATRLPHLRKGGEATPAGALERWEDEAKRRKMIADGVTHAQAGVIEARRTPAPVGVSDVKVAKQQRKGIASHGPRR